MNSTYFTPGPSQPWPELRSYLEDAWTHDVMAISHRGKKFSDIYRRTDSALRQLMNVPDEYGLMFAGSATEVMERILQGMVLQRSHHLVNGSFGQKWFTMAEQLGKKPSVARAEAGNGFAESDLMVPQGVELVCLTHNETSTGARIPQLILEHMASLPDRPLVALDVVSSAPLVDIPWYGLDAVFFSVQKAFGLPAGLGVFIASQRALAKAEEMNSNGISIGSFHSLPELAAGAVKFQTPATPNVLGIYLLGRVAEDMLERGIGALMAENRERAVRLYDAIDESEHLSAFVSNPDWRSTTVVVADVRGGNSRHLEHLEGRGLIPGRGYGKFKDDHLRIANFPGISADMFDELVHHLVQFDG